MEIVDPDLAVIRRILSGDVQAYSEVVRKHQDRVLRLCHSMVGPAEAEDAAQDAFFKAYNALRGFQGRSAFSTWLYRIAANHCLNLIAKRKREHTESLQALIDKTGGNLSILAEKESASSIRALEARAAVQAIFGRLKPEESMILTLRELAGLSYRDLAAAMDLSMDVVKVRLFRARKAFLEAAKEFL